MRPGDVATRLRAPDGEAWRPSQSDRDALGEATALAYSATVTEPTTRQQVAAVFKFSSKMELFGVFAVLPHNGVDLSPQGCALRYLALREALTRQYGTGKDGVSILSNTPRTEWATARLRLKLKQNVNEAGCFIHMSYLSPSFERDVGLE